MLEIRTTTQTLQYFQVWPEVRNYDLGWMIPDWDLTWDINGQSYTHLSRVERNEIIRGQPIYVKGTQDLMPGLPMTLPWDGDTIPLTGAPAGELWLQLVIEAGGTYTDYKGITKDGVCFTDHQDGNFYNPILTTNNVFYWLGGRKSIGGLPHVSFKTLKVGNVNYMRSQLDEFPLLKMKATISRREYGGRGVIPFWHIGGKDVPFLPFAKTDVGWLPEWRVRKLERSEPIPPHYYP